MNVSVVMFGDPSQTTKLVHLRVTTKLLRDFLLSLIESAAKKGTPVIRHLGQLPVDQLKLTWSERKIYAADLRRTNVFNLSCYSYTKDTDTRSRWRKPFPQV